MNKKKRNNCRNAEHIICTIKLIKTNHCTRYSALKSQLCIATFLIYFFFLCTYTHKTLMLKVILYIMNKNSRIIYQLHLLEILQQKETIKPYKIITIIFNGFCVDRWNQFELSEMELGGYFGLSKTNTGVPT